MAFFWTGPGPLIYMALRIRFTLGILVGAMILPDKICRDLMADK